MMHFLKLIRFKNLLLIALVQILIKYVLFVALIGYVSPLAAQAFSALNDWQFAALVFSTLLITAAGYIINDINDIETDQINKPIKIIINSAISENTAFNLYIGLTIIGVSLGMYVANSVGKSAFLALFVIVSGLLYLYATRLKQQPVIGNLVVAFLVALSILIVGVFDLIPIISQQNRLLIKQVFSVLLDYAIFAFIINLIREIVKDIEDVNGDYNQGMKTLPIILGQNRTAKICFGLCIVLIILIMSWLSTYFYKQQIMIIYILLLVIAPLIYCAIKLFSAKQKREFSQISTILKLVMLTGICSMLIFQFIVT